VKLNFSGILGFLKKTGATPGQLFTAIFRILGNAGERSRNIIVNNITITYVLLSAIMLVINR
jgi:hypothetical protein